MKHLFTEEIDGSCCWVGDISREGDYPSYNSKEHEKILQEM